MQYLAVRVGAEQKTITRRHLIGFFLYVISVELFADSKEILLP